MTRAAAVLGFLLTAGVSAGFAQEPSDRKGSQPVDVYGWAGYARFYHGDSYWGRGLELGGSAGVRPFSGALRRFGFEAEFLRSNHFVRTSPDHSKQGSATTIGANALFHFGSGRVQPYLLGGLGWMKADFDIRGVSEWFDPSGHHLERTISFVDTPHYFVNVGAGIKAAIGRGFTVRPEVRLLSTTPGKGANFDSLRLSIGLGYSF
jgi:opacity protein-like surface antigen